MFYIKYILNVVCCVLLVKFGFAQCPDGYTVGGTDRAVNGRFDSGNTGFSSEYTYVANGAGQLELWPEGYYSVWTNPNDLHSNFSACTDATGTGKFMIINGNSIANKYMWRQTINVDPNTLYYFVTEIASVHTTSPARLQFSVNGSLLGSVINASATTCQWDQFYATWNSGSNTTATISIVNQNTATSGNDFALDNIAFVPCTSILPVELVNFNCLNKNIVKIFLSWQTLSETNNDYFTIERSFNNNTFDSITTIKSQNSNSKQKMYYSYTDEYNYDKVSYYRLKQTDFDGKFKYSKTLSVSPCKVYDDFVVTVFPNPTVSKINIEFQGDEKNIKSIVLFNCYGEILYESPTLQPELYFENLSSGFYFIKIVFDSNKVIEKRFIVQ